jgi:hypothetical protein
MHPVLTARALFELKQTRYPKQADLAAAVGMTTDRISTLLVLVRLPEPMQDQLLTITAEALPFHSTVLISRCVCRAATAAHRQQRWEQLFPLLQSAATQAAVKDAISAIEEQSHPV